MGRSVTIELPGVPPSMNALVGKENGWKYREAKRAWTDAVQWAVKAQKAKPPEPFSHADIEITYFFPTNARHDADNYSGKLLLDGLTRGGVIVDDDLRHITTTIRGSVSKTNPRTVLTITEV